ncbi:MAG TPA: hypothetical protein VMP67_09265 [Candidatus Limnocylindria bacterium]|nr:hypothetical protein [Candidatus Limnocylindria bacterium]
MAVLLPGVTALLALIFAVALLDQWRERRGGFQLVWAIGMFYFAVASGSETLAAIAGWNEPLYRTWYLTGAILTAGWLGLGTCLLLARTRFGYAVALCLFLAGLFTFLAARRLSEPAGDAPMLYFIAAGVLAAAVAVETYFQNERWPSLAAVAVGGATLVGLGLILTVEVPAPGYALDPRTSLPTGELFPPSVRLLTPFMNVTGSLALIMGAVFSAYVFMPKKRVLAYSLNAEQSGDSFLFNLFIAPVAITVNFLASLPGALRALLAGRLHSRVPATILIAAGALVVGGADTLARLGSTDFFQLGKLVGVVLLLLGFLVSIEVFREVRVPFTGRVLRAGRQEAPAQVQREQVARPQHSS